MYWANLKANKCPTCHKDLSNKLVGSIFKCPCGFTISVSKFQEIINKLLSKKPNEKHYRPADEDPDY